MLYKFVYHVFAPLMVMPFLKLFNRFHATGFDQMPTQGAAVVVANHISMWDPVIMFCLIRRRAYFMGKKEIFDVPILGPILRRLYVFPVKRDTVDRAALRKAAQVLEEGDILVIYPEGHRSKTSDMLPFKEGAALFAHRAGVPVVPVFFENTPMIFPRSIGQKVRVACGSPLDLTAFYEKKADSALLKEMSDAFRKSIERLREAATSEK